jgi:NAD(P)-dependent dehydrogenase (short-subunit alcohol dehydrogenase family)
MNALAGKVVVITGASSGIGAATARQLAHRGCRLVLGARRIDKLEAVARDCRQSGGGAGKGEAIALPCDVSRRAEVDALVAAAVEKFGRLDVILANAGYGFLAKVHETTEQQFDDILAANVKGTWYAMQAAASVMLRQDPASRGKARRGHIIAVSSGAGRRGLPLYGLYAMTKAAQLSLCEAMRVELAPQGVYVSSVHPLTTATEFFAVASSKSRLRSTGLGHAQPVEVVARKIAGLIARPRPELWPVPFSSLLLAFAAAFPRLADWSMARTVNRRTR